MTRWARLMASPLAIVVVVAMALAATAAVSSAWSIAGKDVPQTTVASAAELDSLPSAGTTEATLAAVLAHGDDDHHDGWWDSGWWIVMPIMMVLFWGGIIAVAVWGIRQFTRGREQRSPLDIAKERLAKGEITKEEFDQLRGDLS